VKTCRKSSKGKTRPLTESCELAGKITKKGGENVIDPMLCQRADKSFDNPDWLFELKLDGGRCIAIVTKDGTKLQGRSGNFMTTQFPELQDLHRMVKEPCILDGEIVCKNFSGFARRVHKQKVFDIRMAQKVNPAAFVAFDVIEVKGVSVANVPLLTRKDILDRTGLEKWEVGSVENPAAILPYRLKEGKPLFEEVQEKQLEGIVAKGIHSTYTQSVRSDLWLKIKNLKMRSFLVCGLTAGEGARKDYFGALILGELVEGKLVYRGNVGTGFDNQHMTWMLQFFKKLEGPAVFQASSVGKPVKFWVKPVVMAEVEYFELGVDGKLRFPTFRKLECDYVPMKKLF
jgi:bifunctional non-homologous end joining protein LigD